MPDWKMKDSFHIKIPFSNATRIRLTQFLFDWAEKRPKTEDWGFLYQLQRWRESQRSSSEKFYEMTRPTEGTKIRLIGFQIFDLFHYEDFDKLLAGLYSMFPNIDETRSDEGFASYFQTLSEPINRGGWSVIGHLYRDNNTLMGTSTPRRHVSTLSPYVNTVAVNIQKRLPSLISVRFDVHLTDSATKDLNDLINRKYLDDTILQKVYLKTRILGIAGTSSKSVMTKTIYQYLESIRANIESLVRPYLRGHFMNTDSSGCKLPAIEIYSIAGTRRNRKSFITWANNSRLWWHSLGFNFFRGSLFGNDKILFSWGDRDGHMSLSKAHRLIIFPETFLSENELKSHSDQARTIWHHLIDFSIAVVDWIICVEFVSSSFQFLDHFRRRVFDTIKGRPTIVNNLTRYVDLHQEFQKLAMILRRFALEFEQSKRYIEHDLQQVEDFQEIDINNSKKKKVSEKPNLAKDILTRIKFSTEVLLGQIDFIEKTYSMRIEFFNIDATYRLQITTIWLTIIATIVTIVGLLNIEQFIPAINELRRLIEAFTTR